MTAPAVRTAAATGERPRSVATYFGAFAPVPDWDDLLGWPPDVFALANLVLDHTEAYRFAVAPPVGRRWPPRPGWDEEVRAEGAAWRSTRRGEVAPPLAQRCFATVSRLRDVALDEVRSGAAWELTTALLTLHALADEACAHVVAAGRERSRSVFEEQAWRLLESRGSLSRIAPARVRIVPKTRFSQLGITIRSLSRHLALSYESVDIRWRSVESESPDGRSAYTILLVPWPLTVRAGDFRPVTGAPVENMDPEHFGFFEFEPSEPLDTGLVDSLLATAVETAGNVDAVILPEVAVHAREIAKLERVLARHGATFLIAGARRPPRRLALGRNYLHFGVRAGDGWRRYEQDKHHRWCLDGSQIQQYHLTRVLDPAKRWWEAMDIRERTLHVIDVGGGITTAPLVCEDLARLDEVAELVRRIGPSLVVAVLLDGPQLRSRWPCRYSSVLTDDPGSVVLTLTSSGMVARSRPPGKPRSRVVAHWNSRTDGLQELELAPGAAALLVTAGVEETTLWTADGRRHADVPALSLAEVRQLRAPRRAGTRT